MDTVYDLHGDSVLAVSGLAAAGVAARRAVFDLAGRAFALALLVGAIPLLLVLAVGVRFTSRGPAFFRQVRVGWGGRPFVVWKLRTMRVDAEPSGSGTEKRRDDPRTTAFGRALRRLSLDEIPQLWNVVRGEMAFVGPRPLPVEQVDLRSVDHRRRLAVRPGLTGLWQVSGRSELPFDEMLRLDAAYVAQRSVSLDAQILLRTPLVVLTGRGAW